MTQGTLFCILHLSYQHEACWCLHAVLTILKLRQTICDRFHEAVRSLDCVHSCLECCLILLFLLLKIVLVINQSTSLLLDENVTGSGFVFFQMIQRFLHTWCHQKSLNKKVQEKNSFHATAAFWSHIVNSFTIDCIVYEHV